MAEAPVIVAEMADWKALGGGNSGICGDPNHTYGFHLTANQTSPDDYSRWRDPNGSDGPYVDWRYCCAGDFSHRNDPKLRAMHANVLARLLRGELPMICEFIGKPYVDQPVLYWARWTGKVQRYTGSGHDTWSHISWYRSMVDQRAYLWVPAPSKEGDDMFCQAGTTYDPKAEWLQRQLNRLGAGLKLDGIYGPSTSAAVLEYLIPEPNPWNPRGEIFGPGEMDILGELLREATALRVAGPAVLVPHTHDEGESGPAVPVGK